MQSSPGQWSIFFLHSFKFSWGNASFIRRSIHWYNWKVQRLTTYHEMYAGTVICVAFPCDSEIKKKVIYCHWMLQVWCLRRQPAQAGTIWTCSCIPFGAYGSPTGPLWYWMIWLDRSEEQVELQSPNVASNTSYLGNLVDYFRLLRQSALILCASIFSE